MLLICLTSADDTAIRPDDQFLEACLERMAFGDRNALAELYGSTKDSVYAFALSILKNTHDAEDVLHDCYVNIYKSAQLYKKSGKPLAWIFTVAKNLCFMKIRAGKRIEFMPDEDFEKYMDSCGADTEDKIILKECMNMLSDEERQIVALHAVAGFKHREIAAITGIALPTVLSKYSRAVKKLRKILEAGGETV